jgi:hypothetical protein
MPPLPLPDSPLVARARAIATGVLADAVVRHSTRTFLLARAYAGVEAISFDDEGLLVAALLHDLGLSEAMRNPAGPFPEVGAAALRRLFGELAADPRRADLLAEAIELHMRLFPRWSRGAEVGLLQVGAWMDVMGRRKARVPAQVREAIARDYPRGGFDGAFRRALIKSLGSLRACSVLVLP